MVLGTHTRQSSSRCVRLIDMPKRQFALNRTVPTSWIADAFQSRRPGR
jgi:hypothetical protein